MSYLLKFVEHLSVILKMQLHREQRIQVQFLLPEGASIPSRHVCRTTELVRESLQPQIRKILAALQDDCRPDPPVFDVVQVGMHKPHTPVALRPIERSFRRKSALTLIASCDVRVGIASTISEAPGTEPAATTAAGQRKATIKVDESLAAICTGGT